MATLHQIERALARINAALGRELEPYTRQPDGTYRANVGTFAYGKDASGYVLEVITNTGGGVTEPLGGRRRTKRELLDQLHAIELGIKAAQQLTNA